MNKEIKILRIMREEGCDWEEAQKREGERKREGEEGKGASGYDKTGKGKGCRACA